MDPAIVGPATLSVTQAIAAMNSFLPPLSEVRKKHPADDPSFAADVRMGEVGVMGLTVGIGVIVSSMTGNSTPAIVGFLIALGIILLYECTLRANRPMEAKAA